MFHKKSEKGQALVLIALAAIGLFGFTALSIDGGMVFSDRRHAQNAADTAVLAAALARVRSVSDPDGAAIAAGFARASSNGYDTDANSTVEVHICDEPGIICEGMPTGAIPSDYVQVKIVSIVHTTFARIVGRATVTNVVTAVARAKVGGPSPVFDGSALVALSQTDPDAVGAGGNVNLDINNSGVFSNSSDTCAMSGTGNINVSVDTAYNIVGGHCQNGSVNFSGGPIQSTSQIEYPPDLDIPAPTITCSGNGQITADAMPNHFTIHPGNYPSLTLNNGTYTFVGNGKFCFHGNVSINGNTDVIANHVDILVTAGSFDINGNSTFNCDYMLVYITGGSGMHFNGNGSNTCTNVTFYAEQGSVTWNGNVANTFTAPSPTTEGGVHQEYANLLIYMPYGNTSPLQINGNAGNTLTGSIIAIQSHVTISGNSGTTGFNSNITGYTVTLAGNSNTVINYRPEDQLTVMDPSDLGLIK
jgi:hypothetical protein